MGEPQEREPLLNPSQGQDDDRRRSSVVSFKQDDSGNPKEWSKKYKWFCVALLCFFAAVVCVLLIGMGTR